MKGFLIAVALAISCSGIVVGYSGKAAQSLSSRPETTPAYGLLVVRKAKVESELAFLSARLSYKHPLIKSKRFELGAIGDEMESLRAVKMPRLTRLSSAVGNLILDKVELEVKLNDLMVNLYPRHPDVTRQRLELVALEREIENVLR